MTRAAAAAAAAEAAVVAAATRRAASGGHRAGACAGAGAPRRRSASLDPPACGRRSTGASGAGGVSASLDQPLTNVELVNFKSRRRPCHVPMTAANTVLLGGAAEAPSASMAGGGGEFATPNRRQFY